MEAYKEWVRRNRQWLSSIESVANTMTWFLPERFAKSELAPEAVSSLVGLVTVMNEHIIATAPVRTPGGAYIAPVQDASFPWPLLVSVVKEMEVLVEMGAEYYLGKDHKWTPVATVEALKAVMRLLVLHKSGYKMLIDGGETANTEEQPSPSQFDPVGRTQVLRPTASSSTPHRAIQAMNKYRENVGVRPSWLSVKPMAPAATAYESRSLKHLGKATVLGEVLLILRPVLYVLLIRRYGLRSWRPWLSALALDATGMTILYGATLLPGYALGKNSKSTTNLPRQEKNELLRRQLLWTLYLMRSPFFNRYTQRRLENVENVMKPVPLFGTLTGKAVELILGHLLGLSCGNTLQKIRKVILKTSTVLTYGQSLSEWAVLYDRTVFTLAQYLRGDFGRPRRSNNCVCVECGAADEDHNDATGTYPRKAGYVATIQLSISPMMTTKVDQCLLSATDRNDGTCI